MEEMSAQAEELAATAEQLRELVARFRLDGEGSQPSSRSGRVSAAVVPLRRAS
ncbi:MAG: hypothetical protein HY329_17020 [Chloroflexi bacterium]|nr:hypothetical protein [Chloroflexota bacterium]